MNKFLIGGLAMVSIGAWWAFSPKRLDYNGLMLIKNYEGLSLEPYNDAAGYKTIGYGHLILEGETFGSKISLADAENLLLKDVKRFEDAVNEFVKVPLTQNMFNSLVSLSYNIGVNGFKESTALRRLNSGDYIGAANAIEMWNKAGGKVVKGLVNRRLDEQKNFFV